MVEAAGQWRRPRSFDARGPSGALEGVVPGPDPGPVVSFASNDYLGLTADAEVVAAAHRALDRWGSGSGASRLVTGSRPVHGELEQALAAWKGCERAVVFPTGFAANLSVLSVFGTEGAHVFSDELNHASIIDGCRLGRAEVTVYPHRDLDTLDRALGATPARSVIVTDSVFSMDGDQADLGGLVGRGRAARRAAGAGRGPRRPRAGAAPRCRRGRRAADGHAVQDPRIPGRLRGRPGPVRGPAGQPGPSLHLHHGQHPGRRRCGVGRGGDRAFAAGRGPPGPVGRSRGAGGPVGGPRRSRRSRSSRWSSGTRPTPSGPRPTSWPWACGCRPSGPPPSPGARRASGSPCPRSTPTTRSTDCSPPWPTSGWPSPPRSMPPPGGPVDGARADVAS